MVRVSAYNMHEHIEKYPMRSEAQRRWMHATHPEMAERWEEHTPKGKKLPEHVKRRRRYALSASQAQAWGTFMRDVGSDSSWAESIAGSSIAQPEMLRDIALGTSSLETAISLARNESTPPDALVTLARRWPQKARVLNQLVWRDTFPEEERLQLAASAPESTQRELAIHPNTSLRVRQVLLKSPFVSVRSAILARADLTAEELLALRVDKAVMLRHHADEKAREWGLVAPKAEAEGYALPLKTRLKLGTKRWLGRAALASGGLAAGAGVVVGRRAKSEYDSLCEAGFTPEEAARITTEGIVGKYAMEQYAEPGVASGLKDVWTGIVGGWKKAKPKISRWLKKPTSRRVALAALGGGYYLGKQRREYAMSQTPGIHTKVRLIAYSRRRFPR